MQVDSTGHTGWYADYCILCSVSISTFCSCVVASGWWNACLSLAFALILQGCHISCHQLYILALSAVVPHTPKHTHTFYQSGHISLWLLTLQATSMGKDKGCLTTQFICLSWRPRATIVQHFEGLWTTSHLRSFNVSCNHLFHLALPKTKTEKPKRFPVVRCPLKNSTLFN